MRTHSSSRMGVLRMARRYAPKVPVHISTQTSILNHEAANLLGG